MEIVITGYGKMGKVIEGILKKRGHDLLKTIDSEKELAEMPVSNAVCIDFTTPDAFKANYKTLAEKFSSVVVGTTGWEDIKSEVIDYFKEKNTNLVYASNFSLGVNIFFEAVNLVSGLISEHADYDPYIIELHHKEKLDVPSGTAITIKKIIDNNLSSERETEISSVRSGYIKGIHEAGFESEYDKISVRHEAYSREGFALGAVIAAEWIAETGGIWNFKDMIKPKLINKK
ncbi:MAG TPA: 4-hydroxy-tetrahydrodipicolinate reductase [Ignavibacteria bacterium]|nr:4-hydroxy-tetrahydrodipicolinate reductase [Ignavibacteria bacterium]HMR40933.1 4-hydroxy-tetrahydrodipicolinate reductase [Ignavibacteria bacterium]